MANEGIITRFQKKMGYLQQEYLGHPPSVSTTGTSQDKGKGILGDPPIGFSPKEAMIVLPMTDLVCMGTPSRTGSVETPLRLYKGWWSKLEQYFEAEGVLDNAKRRTIMLHLEGKTLD
ncbi:hypothetical protein CXB51_005505 [Gossypium anomalum]|uniref:Uncharacterized protein n=1 Tax=Gossypium anomalum TaxID=47600 RepID=A0A8J5YYK6_9ROSI|nr:hypothetical protein CXB51_005505 [Gossypium anomalum]